MFIHPFEDGNGRIHRFLVHNILSLRNVVPEGLMFPVSAAMLKYPSQYDASLEAFSKPLLETIEFDLDHEGELTVEGETVHWYRTPDLTLQAEALFTFMKLTLKEELAHELDFLQGYDETKTAIQEIVDMPDRLVDLFINLCLQNEGSLSTKKRASKFDFLSDEEVARLEETFQGGLMSRTKQ